MNNKIHTPDGLNDILEYETALKREAEAAAMHVFKSFGYFEVQPPSIEFYDVFSSMDQEDMIKFFDSAGRILTLRPDLTTPIARIAATKMSSLPMPRRIFYVGNAFRDTSAYRGALQKEFTQAGIELIGESTPESDAEIIAVTIRTLLAMGLTDFQIEVGQIEYFNGLMEDIEPEIAAQMRELIDDKNVVALTEIANRYIHDEEIREIVLDLPNRFGDISILEVQPCPNERTRAALDNLKEICEIVKEYELEKYVSIDLSLVAKFKYYTGMILKGFARGLGFSICGGGRYDNLIEEFGTPIPATGVAMGIDRLLTVIKPTKPKISADTIFVYNPGMRKIALGIAEILRRDELKIQVWLREGDLEGAREYAREYRVGGILHFAIDGVDVIDVANNTVKHTSLEELLA